MSKQTHEHTVLVTGKAIKDELKNLEEAGWEVFQVENMTPHKWRVWAKKRVTKCQCS
jgi:hypothetical protein